MDDFDFIPGYSTSTAAPKLPDYEEPKKKQSQPRKNPKQQVKTYSPTRQAIKTAVVGTVSLVVIMAMAFSIISLNKMITDNSNKITKLDAEISQAQSENVRLTAELGAMMSADKIQEYAVSVLGMQQAERYQIHYFEDRDGDKIVVADGKLS